MKREKKLISFILSIALAVAMLPSFRVETFAESGTEIINSIDKNHPADNFEAAFATEGGVVYLSSGGVSTSVAVSISDLSQGGSSYTLDLNGCVVSGVSFKVQSGDKLIITDSCSQTAVHYYHYSSVSAWTLADLDNNLVTEDAITLGAVNWDTTEGALVAVSGGAIYGGYSYYDGGGICNEGILTLSGINIIGNYADGLGGGIYNSSTAALSGVNIIGNYAAQCGGGIYNSGKSCNITDSTISYNTTVKGGGIFNSSDSTFNIADSTISYNTAENGGGVYNYDECNIADSTISYNTAKIYGGGVIDYYGTNNISGVTISYNTANQFGGIFSSGSCDITDSTISYNTAALFAGACLSDVTFSGIVKIENNVAESDLKNNLICISNNATFDNFNSSSKIYVTRVHEDFSTTAASFTADLSEASAAAYKKAFFSDVDSFEIITSGSGANSSLATSYITAACIVDDETKYESLQKAIDECISGSTIKLLRSTEGSVEFATGKAYILDLNGKTFSSDNKYGISNSGILVIDDSSDSYSGKIYVLSNTDEAYGITNGTGASLTVNSGSIVANSNSEGASAIYNCNGFVSIVNDNVTLSALSSGYQAMGIYNELGCVDIQGGYIYAKGGRYSYAFFSDGSPCSTISGINTKLEASCSDQMAVLCFNTNINILNGSYIGDFYLDESSLKISGGRFTIDPAAYVPDGYIVWDMPSSELPYMYEVKEIVCYIEGDEVTSYGAVSDALESSKVSTPNAVIVLVADTTEYIDIESGRVITIDLNGHKIKSNGQIMTNSGILTVLDSSVNHQGMLEGYVTGILNYGELLVTDAGIKVTGFLNNIKDIENYGSVTIGGLSCITSSAIWGNSYAVLNHKDCLLEVKEGTLKAISDIRCYTILNNGIATISGINTYLTANNTYDVSDQYSLMSKNNAAVTNVVDGYLNANISKSAVNAKIVISGGKFANAQPEEFLASGLTFTYSDATPDPYKWAVAEKVSDNYVVYYNYNTCLKGYSCVLTRFNDVVNTAWYHDGLHYCVERGYMQGYDLVTFGPNDMLSRSMVVRMLWNVEGTSYTYTSTTYTDAVAGSWYYSALAWAEACKVVDGYGDGTFGVNDNITREQLAKILYTYAKYKGYDVSKTAELTYPDAKDVSSWAKDAVVWANAEGIIQGKDTGLLDPKGYASRAEAATMLMRLLTLR